MPNNVKVLLVDDNPMVLGMLQGALTRWPRSSPPATRRTRCSRRLMILPTCWSATIACPASTDQLAERLKGRAATAGISVILLATKADISERLSHHEPLDDFVEKPFFPQGSNQAHQARDRQNRARKDGEDRSLRWSPARQLSANECD